MRHWTQADRTFAVDRTLTEGLATNLPQMADGIGAPFRSARCRQDAVSRSASGKLPSARGVERIRSPTVNSRPGAAGRARKVVGKQLRSLPTPIHTHSAINTPDRQATTPSGYRPQTRSPTNEEIQDVQFGQPRGSFAMSQFLNLRSPAPSAIHINTRECSAQLGYLSKAQSRLSGPQKPSSALWCTDSCNRPNRVVAVSDKPNPAVKTEKSEATSTAGQSSNAFRAAQSVENGWARSLRPRPADVPRIRLAKSNTSTTLRGLGGSTSHRARLSDAELVSVSCGSLLAYCAMASAVRISFSKAARSARACNA